MLKKLFTGKRSRVCLKKAGLALAAYSVGLKTCLYIYAALFNHNIVNFYYIDNSLNHLLWGGCALLTGSIADKYFNK
jgi:hypothetical protein